MCDIGHDLQQKKVNFAEFDFSHMADTDELWFIDHLQPHHHDQYRRHVDKQSSVESTGSFEEKQQQLLSLMKEKMIYETPS